jgi:hypothetical protein
VGAAVTHTTGGFANVEDVTRSSLVVFAVPLLVLAGCGAPAMPVPTLALPSATPVGAGTPGVARAGKNASDPEPEPAGRYCFDPVRDVRQNSSTRRPLGLVRAERDRAAAVYDSLPPMVEEKSMVAVGLGDTESELAGLEPATSEAHEAEALTLYTAAAKGKGPSADEAKYRLALTFECQGNFKEERRLLFDIVSNAPKSRLVPYAYFAFGELFAKEAATDPTKLPLAIQAFDQAAKSAGSPLLATAQSRLGELRARSNAEPAP